MRSIIRLVPIAFLSLALPGIQAQEDPQATPSGPWPESVKPAETDATSRKIFDLHLKARGGRDALARQKAMSLTGELVESAGKVDYRLKITHVAPDLILTESVRTWLGDDYKVLSGYDGENAWTQEVLPERKNPTRLSGFNRQLLELDAMLPYLLLNPDANGHLFAYRGRETFTGKKVYVVHGWLSNGMQIEILFDAKTFHILNYRQPYRIGSETVIIDRMPTGLMRMDKTWWENGYSYRVRGKSFRKVSYASVTGGISPEKNLFKEPPTRERWLRSDSIRNREG